jgi:ureidoglycolate dehydrogenase (NAD+)
LGDAQWLAERMRDFASIVHSTPRSDDAKPIRLPGEIELERLERQRRDGIAIDAAVEATLRQLAQRIAQKKGGSPLGDPP